MLRGNPNYDDYLTNCKMMELFYENDDTEEFDVDTIKLNQIRSGRLK